MTQQRLPHIFPHLNSTTNRIGSSNNINNNNISIENSLLEKLGSIGTMRVGLNPNQFSQTRKIIRNRNDRNRPGLSIFSIITGVMAMLGIIYFVVILRISSLPKSSSSSKSSSTNKDGAAAAAAAVILEKTAKRKPATCDFRKYPPRRYYGLHTRPLPDFLQKEYIYGELPQLLRLPPHPLAETSKLCVDQSEWYHEDPSIELPFADGTNPSILKIPTTATNNNNNNNNNNSAWGTTFPNGAKYLMTICMTNSQCTWKDSPEESRDYRLSKQTKPATVRTVLLILDEGLNTLQESTIEMVMDANLGKKKFRNGELQTFALDDARLFTYNNNNELWVSYREGKLMGYENQVLNRVHFTEEGVRLYASEVELLCCGRNMALMDDGSTTLQALTWVDPITVVDVKMTKEKNKKNGGRRRRLQQNLGDGRIISSNSNNNNSNPRRRLKQEANKKKKKSDFHGTNGMMVHLPQTNEYLGIGHFHRPPERDFDNPYARFGHHYTHAFFTIPDRAPFRLKRLSAELVLPSHAHADDAEIIQFWSGLELVNDDTLLLAYGINDCEGAATYVDLSTVEDLLRDVPEGKEVVDLMMPLREGI